MLALLIIFGMTLVFGVYAVALVVGLWKAVWHSYAVGDKSAVPLLSLIVPALLQPVSSGL